MLRVYSLALFANVAIADVAEQQSQLATDAILFEQLAEVSNSEDNSLPGVGILDATSSSMEGDNQDIPVEHYFDLKLRNYFESQHVDGRSNRHAWVQSMRANLISPYTDTSLGVGIDASLFAAHKLDGGRGAGNLVYTGENGEGAGQRDWAYLGIMAVKFNHDETVAKYGLQQVENPFLESKDDRSLPPTFKGLSLIRKFDSNLIVDMGSFDGVVPRGQTHVQPLSSAYGGTPISRLSYMGTNWEYAADSSLSIYAAQARDTWNELYASVQKSMGAIETKRVTVNLATYLMRNQGSSEQGNIHINAYSGSLSIAHEESEITAAFQYIQGDQYLDYIQESNGLYLANGMVADYNAPNETSVQLRYKWTGNQKFLEGSQIFIWCVAGYGEEGSAVKMLSDGEQELASWRDAYWKNGSVVHGRHYEFGFKASHEILKGSFKDTKIAVLGVTHRGSNFYPEPTERAIRVMINVPITLH